MMVVNSINPVSASPVNKGRMAITGNHFGTDPAMLEVHLVNTDRSYQCRILKVMETEIQVGFSGGLEGNYQLQVNKKGYGNALASPSNAN